MECNDTRECDEEDKYNVAAGSYSAPFFFFTLKTGYVIRNIMAGTGRGMDWRINLGVVVLGMLLIISAIAVVAFLVLPLALYRRSSGPGPGTKTKLTPLLYFIAVGFGYILVEISLIQLCVLLSLLCGGARGWGCWPSCSTAWSAAERRVARACSCLSRHVLLRCIPLGCGNPNWLPKGAGPPPLMSNLTAKDRPTAAESSP